MIFLRKSSHFICYSIYFGDFIGICFLNHPNSGELKNLKGIEIEAFKKYFYLLIFFYSFFAKKLRISLMTASF